MVIPLAHIEEGLTLTIEPEGDSKTCEIKQDAYQNGESPYQIGEGQEYQYQFSNPNYGFIRTDYAKPFKNKPDIGIIRPNIYVGTLGFDLLKKVGTNWTPISEKVELEVQSVKSSYREDYRHMLEEITEACFDLILQVNSPVSQTLTVDFGHDSQTDYQRFCFVKSMIESETFQESVQRVLSSPTTSWSEIHETNDIRKVKRLNRNEVRQIIFKSNRSPIPKDHFLNNYGIASLPDRIDVKRKVDSLDTAENRFIKHALEAFLHFTDNFEKSVDPNTREGKEARAISSLLEEWLSHNLFKEVSRPTTLKLNSPVLQRREGYREILKVWVMFDLAAKLIWKGGDDVYQAGKKDIAKLYEYWLFFKLLDLFQEMFQIEANELKQIISSNRLNLKEGNHIPLKGIYDSGSRKLNIQFSYNRSFSGSNPYPNEGSWTKGMRPDYTLSVWPKGLEAQEAEHQELITHIHFDAKYKIKSFLNYAEELSIQKEEEFEAKGEYKNADLLKMHAYRDAIRRTAGAYVLYPGTEVYQREGFHEIMPGLGAFPVRPSKTNSGITDLKRFILELINTLTNRASQKELSDSKRYFIHKSKSEDNIQEPMPDNYGINRELHPLETTVIVGYYKSPEHLAWIKKTGLYNGRINTSRGSISIDKEMAGAKFLFLHGSGDSVNSHLFEIIEGKTKIFIKQKLIDKKYPSPPTQDAYIVFKLKSAELDDFGKAKWDVRKLPEFESWRNSPLPKTTTLFDLMKAKAV